MIDGVLTCYVDSCWLTADLPSAGPGNTLALKLILPEILLHFVTRDVDRGLHITHSCLWVHEVLLHRGRVSRGGMLLPGTVTPEVDLESVSGPTL